MSINSYLRCSLWLMHLCQQENGLTIMLQNIVLRSQCHMPVFLYTRTGPEDALEDYLIPDTAMLMDVLYRFIFLSLMWILLFSWLSAVTATASDVPDMSSVFSHLYWEWLFLIPQTKIKNNPLQEPWKCSHLIYFSEFFVAGKIRFIKCYRIPSALALGH